MKNIRTTLALLSVMLMPLSVSSIAAAQTADQACKVVIAGANTSVNSHDPRFVESNGVVTTTVNVTGPADCQQTVTLTSWQAPFGADGFLPIASQTMFKSTTSTFGVGTHTISVAVPSCNYQVDLLYGSKATAANGTAAYGYDQIFADTQVKSTTCGQPAAVVTPTQVDNTSAAAASQPTELVNTGAGSVAGIFAGAVAAGALGYQMVTRKLLNRA